MVMVLMLAALSRFFTSSKVGFDFTNKNNSSGRCPCPWQAWNKMSFKVPSQPKPVWGSVSRFMIQELDSRDRAESDFTAGILKSCFLPVCTVFKVLCAHKYFPAVPLSRGLFASWSEVSQPHNSCFPLESAAEVTNCPQSSIFNPNTKWKRLELAGFFLNTSGISRGSRI